MRRIAAAIVTALAVAACTTAASAGLDPGGLTPLTETGRRQRRLRRNVYFTANHLPGRVNLDVNTVEGWNQRNASENYVAPDLFLAEVKDLPSGFDSTLTADYQDIKMSREWNRCSVR